MPDAWSKKDARQYRHIFESALWRGLSRERAKEIAARTINKERRRVGPDGNASPEDASQDDLIDSEAQDE
jgi:hypothetical protein